MSEQDNVFERGFTKEQIKQRDLYARIENSEIPASEVDIKQAVDNALADVRARLGLKD